jgi:hypothetical protein
MVSILYFTCTVSKLTSIHISIQYNVISRHATRTQNPDFLHGVVDGNVYIKSVLYIYLLYKQIVIRHSSVAIQLVTTAERKC